MINRLSSLADASDWICAGGYPLSLAYPEIPYSDIDIFSTDSVRLAAMVSERSHKPVNPRGDVLDVGMYQFIPAKKLEGHSLAETVLGSFDFGITQIGFDGEQLLVTDLWKEHARQGLIEFDPEQDPWHLRSAQIRARKMHRKLGWKIGPMLGAYLCQRAEEKFAPPPPGDDKRRWFITYLKAQPVTKLSVDEAKEFIHPSQGPKHLLEVIYGN